MVEGAALEMLCAARHLGFESLTLRHKKPVNKPVYRLFNFCLKGKARTIFGFQGRKSAVLPGTDRPPAAAEVAALRQRKPCLCRNQSGYGHSAPEGSDA